MPTRPQRFLQISYRLDATPPRRPSSPLASVPPIAQLDAGPSFASALMPVLPGGGASDVVGDEVGDDERCPRGCSAAGSGSCRGVLWRSWSVTSGKRRSLRSHLVPRQRPAVASRSSTDRPAADRCTRQAPTFGPPKTASSIRTVPIPDLVLQALAEHVRRFPLGPHGVIFSGSDGQLLRRSAFSNLWRRINVEAGVQGRTFHSLRHHYASLLIRR